MGIGRSHGKIILIGEHSVVYQQPAIALPILSANTIVETAQLANATDHWIISPYYTGALSEADSDLQGLSALIMSTLASIEQNEIYLSMTIKSNIPPQRGMGSSAAISVAIVRSIYSYFNLTLSNQQLFALVDIEEQITHGNPSGLDAVTTVAKQPVWYIKGQPIQPLIIKSSGVLVVLDSGIFGKTSEAVTAVREQLLTHRRITMERILALGKLTRLVRHDLTIANSMQLGQHLNEAQVILQQLSVSNQQMDKYVDIANNLGSLGTKLTGGGRGGCLIAILPNLDQAKLFGNQMIDHGIKQVWYQPLSHYHEASQKE